MPRYRLTRAQIAQIVRAALPHELEVELPGEIQVKRSTFKIDDSLQFSHTWEEGNPPFFWLGAKADA